MIFNNNTVPIITNMGVFNSDLVFKGMNVTANRNVSLFEIELPLEPVGCSYINENEYKITTNELICAKPGSIRHSELPYKCYYIHIYIEEKNIVQLLSEIPDLFLISDREVYKNLFEEMIEAYTSPKMHSEIFIQSKFLELIYKMYHDSFQISAGNVLIYNKIIKNAINYINEHFRENVSLERIADYVHMSKIYFRKQFIEATGMSPHEYVKQQRISEAKKQLFISLDSISDIAYNSGFSSQSYFNYVFKKETGTSPKNYREKTSKNYIDII